MIPELVYLITAELDQPELVITSLLNSNWRKQSQLVLYSDPVLYSKPDDWKYYLERVNQLTSTLQARGDFSSSIQRLRLFTYTGEPEDEDEDDPILGLEETASLLSSSPAVRNVAFEG